MVIVTISHLINVVVAGSMGVLLLVNAPAMIAVYGDVTPARSILASVYLAIAIASLFALIVPAYSSMIAKVLFPLQIIYKLITIVAVGSISHPVVLSNVFISIVHAVSLFVLFRK